MATTRSFDDMLNEYLPEELMRNEFEKRQYLMTVCEKDNGWKGGTIPIPFEGNQASSIEFGQFTAESDVSEDDMVRGTISAYKELTGTMVFNFTDLNQHNGKVPETSFLRILPSRVEIFANWLKTISSIVMLNGPRLAKLSQDGDTAGTGIVTVDRIDRFTLKQKVILIDDDSAGVNRYITAIDVNKKQLTLSATRGGGAATAVSYTTAQNARLLIPSVNTGTDSDYFVSLRQALLPTVALGGVTSLYGQTKTSFPYLQGWHRHGGVSADDGFGRAGLEINATNIVEKIFDVFIEMRQFTVGNPPEVWVSYKHFGSILKLLQAQMGAFRTSENSRKSTQYGWDEVVIYGIKGSLKVVAIQEMDDDVIMLIDPKAVKFYSNGLVKQVMTPEGLRYYTTRAQTGYKFFLDWIMYGELVLLKPQACAIIHSISY